MEPIKYELYTELYDTIDSMDEVAIHAYFDKVCQYHEHYKKIVSELKDTDSPDYDEMLVSKALLKHIDNEYKERFGDSLLYPELFVVLSVSSDITKDFIPAQQAFSELPALVNNKDNYSPSIFRDYYRDTSHFIGGNNCIVLDIDDGWSIPEAMDFLNSENLRAFVTTTKSHQQDKNGKVCDRFRIFLPTKQVFSGTPVQFSTMMEAIFRFFGNKPDRVAKDCTRFYFGNPDGISYLSEGRELLDLSLFPTEVPRPQRVSISKPEGAISKWFENNASTGNRNSMLYRAYRFYLDNGKSNDQSFHLVMAINAGLSDPLTEKEVQAICRVK
jgi:hypothetical protein